MIDFNAVPCGVNTCFTMVLINNSNAETTRVGDLLRNSTDGTVGLYLKQVGGSVLASLMDSSTFEPASTIKIATHLYTFRQIQAGAVSLDTNHYEILSAGVRELSRQHAQRHRDDQPG